MKAASIVNKIFAVTTLVIGGLQWSALAAAQSAVTLSDIHGLGYSADGRQLEVPSHDGIAIYNAGRWSKGPAPRHDYMGFTATKERYYSSGHPGPGAGLTNPLGLVRSDDGGKSWTKMGLEGQADFHLLAAGYANNAIYVFNTATNARMAQPGLYYTLNDGLAWRRAEAAGLNGTLISLAVHPTDPRVVAAGTNAGLFLSRDAGATFTATTQGSQVLALRFEHDGSGLWASTLAQSPRLLRIEWASGKSAERPLPPMSKDAVSYIAQNPTKPAEFALATFERSVFISGDGGSTWRQIVNRGGVQ